MPKLLVRVIQELIDTLWNVNELQSSSNYKELMELIDTLWNVNAVEFASSLVTPWINRYIMECKFCFK